MTKKVNTGLTGAETSLAAALLNAGVKPASDSTVPAAALAPATPTSAATAPNPPAPAPTNPTSADAAITASSDVQQEIADAKRVWEHAKAAGISKDQFLTFCEIDAEKFALFKTHKKAIFGSKKQEMDEAAEVVVNANTDTVVNTVNKINEAPDYVRRALKLIKKGEQITRYLESLSKAQRKEVKAALRENYETNKGKKKVANANGYPNIPLMHSLGWRADLYQ